MRSWPTLPKMSTIHSFTNVCIPHSPPPPHYKASYMRPEESCGNYFPRNKIAGDMSCISKETKKKVVGADLFQTPATQEASTLGAFNSFFVLPVAIIVYASLLSTIFNPTASESEMVITEKCTPFHFTCTAGYGCEIAALGKHTTEKFSKRNKSLHLEQGEDMEEFICPGLSEALDIAPRAFMKVNDSIYSSFKHGGFGYFGGNNIIYQVNLKTMRLVSQKSVGVQLEGLNVGFAYAGYGYFGGNHFILKFDLKTLAVVNSKFVEHHVLTGFAYNGCGYFGGHGTIFQINLTTLETKKQNTVSTSKILASVLDIEDETSFGYFGSYGKMIYKVNLTTLNVTARKNVGERLNSACCSGQVWGTESGKVLTIDAHTLNVDSSNNIGDGTINVVTTNFAIASSSARVVRYYPVYIPTNDVVFVKFSGIFAGFQTGENLYLGSRNGFIGKVEVDNGESIGRIDQLKPLNFPPVGKMKYFSLFTTTTTTMTIMNMESSIDNYMYQSKHVDSFDDVSSKTVQPDYLCRRVNLGPTQLKVTKHPRYNMYVLVTLCLTVSSTVFSALKLCSKYAPEMYAKMKGLYERRGGSRPTMKKSISLPSISTSEPRRNSWDKP